MASVITTQPTANNASENVPLEAEQPDTLAPEEPEKKKKEFDRISENVEDCCCYFDEESFILLRCISSFCQCIASCTEQCCECCGDCLQNSCEGNNDDGSGGLCCDCSGSSSNNGDDDCDCDCFG